MGYLKRIEQWKSTISTACWNSSDVDVLGSFEAENVSLLKDTTDLGHDAEISFRETLSDLLKANTDKEMANINSAVFRLLKFAFSFAVRYGSTNPLQIPKVPYLLIEDLMESQTIEKSETIWAIIDSMQDLITHPELFPKGKLTMLRICNSLLRKLSKSCNTEFCGKVLMFLAAVYPLSEKSALNLSCKVNTNNITYFESAEQFAQSMGATTVHSATGGAGEKEGAGEGENEVEVEVEGEEGGMEVVELSEEEEGAESGTGTGAVQKVSYDMYQAFWKLQSFFASEQKVADSADLWRDFMQHARRVVTLFEANDFTDAELQQQAHSQQQQDKDSTMSGGNAGLGLGSGGTEDASAHYSGCKYLTSSQLFTLQLRDPIVRQQIAVQILYFVHYLRTKSSVLAATGTTGAAAVTVPEKVAGLDQDMLFLHDRACTIIERSPNDGGRLLGVLKRLLGRERSFIAWKTLGCPEIEIPRPVLSDTEAAKLEAADLNKDSSNSFSLYKKRPIKVKVKRSAGLPASKVEQLLSGYQFDFSDAHVKEVARELVKNIPTYEQEIQQYVDAEDPDAGIEEEYHPKKNNLYCWRARRLLAAQHLSAFEAMLDGDIGKGLRKLNNQPEPVESAGSEQAEGEGSSADAEAAETEAADTPGGEDEAEGGRTTENDVEGQAGEGDDNMAVSEENSTTSVAATAGSDKPHLDRKEKWRQERADAGNKRRKTTAASNAKVDSVEEGEEQE